MATLIIYYSQTEATSLISETLAYELQADIVRIKDLKSRDGFKNKLKASFDAFRENKTEIYPPTLDLSKYDTIYIGTPVWAGKPTPAIVTIIDSCDLRGKDIILYAVMADNGGIATIDRLTEKVKARGARVIESFTIKTKDRTEEQLIKVTESLIDMLSLKIYNKR